MSPVQEDHDEAFLPFVGIIIAELTSATVVLLENQGRGAVNRKKIEDYLIFGEGLNPRPEGRKSRHT